MPAASIVSASFVTPETRPGGTPRVLRLAGCWLIGSAWCSTAGWLLSAVGQLDGWGYLVLSPVLLAAAGCWLKSTESGSRGPGFTQGLFRRLRQPAPLAYFLIAGLSLLGGGLYAPWSADAVNYRLPRILYWWQAHHWYWTGALDHRLDFSSAGFEWQMLPLVILTRTDRFLFLLNWFPFLLMPGLVFLSFRGLGINGRSARRWMWLLPCALCIALQAGSVQNDGYSVDYLLSAVAFAVAGFYANRLGFVWMSMLAAALLTGAKLSNLPLLLPLAVLSWPALRRVRLFNWKTVMVLLIAVLCSFAPLCFLCWRTTGDWTGDPDDQWNVKTRNPAGAVAANLLILLNDAAQPPYFPGNNAINARLETLNDGKFIAWLHHAQGEFENVHFGDMPYEGGAGPGMGIAAYTAVLFLAALRRNRSPKPGVQRIAAAQSMPPSPSRPRLMQIAPWLAWISYLVFLAKLGSYLSARIAAPYYPLLLVTLVRCPGAAAFERKRVSGVLAVLAAAAALFVILLTPIRPLFPIQTLAGILPCSALEKAAAKYRAWADLSDRLAPLREHLPPDAGRLGYAGGFSDSPYGLFKPFGGREIIELGLPLGSDAPPPPNLKYAVVTTSGLKERYRMDLPAWLARVHGRVIFQYAKNTALTAHEAPRLESWSLVRLDGPPKRD